MLRIFSCIVALHSAAVLDERLTAATGNWKAYIIIEAEEAREKLIEQTNWKRQTSRSFHAKYSRLSGETFFLFKHFRRRSGSWSKLGIRRLLTQRRGTKRTNMSGIEGLGAQTYIPVPRMCSRRSNLFQARYEWRLSHFAVSSRASLERRSKITQDENTVNFTLTGRRSHKSQHLLRRSISLVRRPYDYLSWKKS